MTTTDAEINNMSDESKFTTGQVLAVSGRFGLGTPLYGEMIKWFIYSHKNLKEKCVLKVDLYYLLCFIFI